MPCCPFCLSAFVPSDDLQLTRPYCESFLLARLCLAFRSAPVCVCALCGPAPDSALTLLLQIHKVVKFDTQVSLHKPVLADDFDTRGGVEFSLMATVTHHGRNMTGEALAKRLLAYFTCIVCRCCCVMWATVTHHGRNMTGEAGQRHSSRKYLPRVWQ